MRAKVDYLDGIEEYYKVIKKKENISINKLTFISRQGASIGAIKQALYSKDGENKLVEHFDWVLNLYFESGILLQKKKDIKFEFSNDKSQNNNMFG